MSDSLREIATASQPSAPMQTGHDQSMHGLHGDWREPDWPAWTLAEADELLERYDDAGRAVKILSHSPRPFSSAARVQTTAGALILKRHARAVRSVDSLREEHAFAAWLAARTSLVTAPLRARNGHTAIAQGEWTCEVFPVARGFDLYEQAMSWTTYRSVSHAHSAGVALADLHTAAQGYAAPPRGIAPLVTSFTLIPARDAAAALRRYCAARPRLREWLNVRNGEQEFLERFLPWQRQLQLASAPNPAPDATNRMLTPLWTHNDWHGSNLIWSGIDDDAHVTAVIDFGLADLACPALDIATALERSVFDWLALETGQSPATPQAGESRLAHESQQAQQSRHNPATAPCSVSVNSAQAAALLAGYARRRPMTRQDRRIVAAVLPIAHCEFALSETDYFLSVLDDEARARVAWNEYCLGHMDWFADGPGAQWMEWMRAWAEDETSVLGDAPEPTSPDEPACPDKPTGGAR